MKFERKYPNMEPGEEKDCILKSNVLSQCEICGDLTEFIEINYEAHFCSDECVSEMDKSAAEYNLWRGLCERIDKMHVSDWDKYLAGRDSRA